MNSSFSTSGTNNTGGSGSAPGNNSTDSTGFGSSTDIYSVNNGDVGTSSSYSSTSSTTTGIVSTRDTSGGIVGVISDVKNFVNKIISLEVLEKVGETVGNTIPVAGAVAGVTTTLASLIFTQAVSFSELAFLPLRIWSSALLLFGVTRRKPWGVVYDSLTKQPIDPAYVTLINIQTNKEIASNITDINGRYGFENIPVGHYKIVASKTNYKFPSNYLKTETVDEIYDDLYFGQEFEVIKDRDLVAKNIPIDSTSIDWNEVAKREKNLISFNPVHENRWQKIAHLIFIAGFIAAILTTIYMPTRINKISLIFYIVCGIVLYAMRIPKIRALFSKSHALVIDTKNDIPMQFAKIEIINPETSIVVTKRVTNQDGLFYALLEKGEYKVAISKSEKVGSYTKVFESKPLTVKKGFISETFEV